MYVCVFILYRMDYTSNPSSFFTRVPWVSVHGNIIHSPLLEIEIHPVTHSLNVHININGKKHIQLFPSVFLDGQ